MEIEKTSHTRNRYVMHIGRHKTGTSSLQRCLASSEIELRSQGIIYPSEGRRGGVNHYPLAGVLGAKTPKSWSDSDIYDFERGSLLFEDAVVEYAQRLKIA